MGNGNQYFKAFLHQTGTEIKSEKKKEKKNLNRGVLYKLNSLAILIIIKSEKKKEKKNLNRGVLYKLNSLAISIEMELIRFPAMFVYSLIYIVPWFIYSLFYLFIYLFISLLDWAEDTS